MFSSDKTLLLGLLVTASLIGGAPSPAAALGIEGQVQAGGGSVAGSTVTLWAGGAGEPKQLAQAKTGDDGSFALNSDETPGAGRKPLSRRQGRRRLGQQGQRRQSGAGVSGRAWRPPPAKVTINEMTTVASVWTNAQFLDGAILKGPALSLSIAAGNVANFVDLQTGG